MSAYSQGKRMQPEGSPVTLIFFYAYLECIINTEDNLDVTEQYKQNRKDRLGASGKVNGPPDKSELSAHLSKRLFPGIPSCSSDMGWYHYAKEATKDTVTTLRSLRISHRQLRKCLLKCVWRSQHGAGFRGFNYKKLFRIGDQGETRGRGRKKHWWVNYIVKKSQIEERILE